MSNIIDFGIEKVKKETDAQYILKMPDGSIWYKFTASYDFSCSQGSGVPEYILNSLPSGTNFAVDTYSIEFWAQSEEEALRRIEAIKQTLQYTGRFISEILT